ncbi:hypothetical protein EVAR_59944_1 [Eumeta japonica]|uniref:Histone-lysine N-methyltransferase SETMAR n=1 Tax=Eumeta variegata TaxID=151549 RepID=A0A4C1ZHI7_EUMVA|nr:hypothetical protein EVAR_59944_1 [Eumeta japonica]
MQNLIVVVFLFMTKFVKVGPPIAITEENVATVKQFIDENRRITYEEIRGHLGIGEAVIASSQHVQNMLSDQ